jgi:type III secretory pathway component EscT
MQGYLADGAALQAVAVFCLLCARVLPLSLIVARAGLRGVAALPLALTLVLALCLYPSAAAAAPVLPSGLLALSVLSLREALIGLVYAFALALPLVALTWSGALAGRLSGVAGIEAPLALLQQWLGLAAFFALGGHRVVIAVLARAVSVRPLGSFDALSGIGALALGSARLVADAFASALLIALPVGAALLLVELGAVLAMRAASAPLLQHVLVPGRALLLLCVLCLFALFAIEALPDFFSRALYGTQRLLGTP